MPGNDGGVSFCKAGPKSQLVPTCRETNHNILSLSFF